MTQEQKDILLKDLCARLPHGVICKDTNINITGTLSQIGLHYDMCVLDKDNGDSESCYILNCKPYLFPLSSMTEEQKKELSKLGVSYGEYALHDDTRGLGIMVDEVYIFFEFCYKHHIDFLGLIEMGLAINATGLNIY